MNNLRDLYDLKDDEVREVEKVKTKLEKIRKDYQIVVKSENNSSKPYSELSMEIERLSMELIDLDGEL